MARKLRLKYPGAIYHVMSRGDQRDDIFLDDVDRHDIIKTLAEAQVPPLRVRCSGSTPVIDEAPRWSAQR